MTRDDIIKLFEKANGWSPAAYLNTMDDLERFAALVAAAEREACAKVADMQDGDDEGDVEACIWSEAARHIAAAVRARGQA